MRMHLFHRDALSRVMATAAATAAAVATLTAGIVVAPQTALAAEPTPAGPDNAAAGSAKIGVLSDTHYYPANYADDDDDFHDYVGGDPKLLEESNAISDKAVDMIIKDHPDYVLVTGDLTKDGEQQAEIDIANKFQKIEDETQKAGYNNGKGTQVFVINGNHDIYNTDAWNFNEGTKQREPAPLVNSKDTFIANDPHFHTKNSKGESMVQGATDPKFFRTVMANFGYKQAAEQDAEDRKTNPNAPSHFFHNPGNTNTDFNDPAHYRDANGVPTKVAGELSYYVDDENFRFVAIDSGKYSPDAETGYDYNEHVTAGRIDPTLLPWLAQVTKDADSQGKTVIGFLHHGIVPHFVNEDKTLNEYVVDNWQQVATTLADAGMRWMFTGHVHVNDRADYVSPNGNQLTDIQTGALASYGTPVRYVDFYRGQELGGTQGKRHAETMDVKTVSVGRDPNEPSKHVDITVHCGYGVTLPADSNGQWSACNTDTHEQVIHNLEAYTKRKLYGDGMITDMAVGTVRPMMEKIGKQGLKEYLAVSQPDLDLKKTISEYLTQYLSSPMTISGSVYTAQAWYANGALHLKGIGGMASVLGETTISDDQIMDMVYDLLAQIDVKFLQNPDYLADQIKTIVDQISKMQPVSGSGYALVNLVSDLMTNHLQGAESSSLAVNQDKIKAGADAIAQGGIVRDVIDLLLNTIVPEGGNGTLDGITSQLAINWSKGGLSGLWLTVLNAATSNGNLKSTLDTFGFNAAKIRSIVNDKVEEYMSPSFLSGMGGIFKTIIMQMATDSVGDDDVENSGQAVRITYTGTKTPFDPDDAAAGAGQPTQISMSLGKDTVKDRAFRWYARSFYDTTKTNADHGFDTVTKAGQVQVCRDAGCTSVVSTQNATAEQVIKPKTLLNLGLTSGYGKDLYTKYSAQVTGLTVGERYWYRVSSGDYWSTTTAFTTGSTSDKADSFSFLNVDDSQGMIPSDYDTYHKTLVSAQATMPNTAFTVHGGDVVDEGSNEDYWTWLLDGDNERSMAVAATTGNHEDKSHVPGVTDPNPIRSHFNIENLNVPEQSGSESTGTYYSYTYKNALFVVLNSNDLGSDNALSPTQIAWAQQVVSQSDAKWKFLVLHKSPYSNGPHHADADVVAIRKQLTAFAATNHIDMVLSGHDHTYNRTDWLDRDGKKTLVDTSTQEYAGQNFNVVNNPNGTVYAIAGTAGVKNYQQHEDPAVESAVSLKLDVPAYAGITIDGDMLYYRAYKVENGRSVQIDSFAINKGAPVVEKTDVQKVIDQIDALPSVSSVKTSDESAVAAAEAAYNKLSGDDKPKVTNYDKLVAVRKMLDALKAAANGQVTQACTKEGFIDALNQGAAVIEICGDFQVEGTSWLPDDSRILHVDHDTVIRSNGSAHTIKQVELQVRNGARLMIDGSNGALTLDGTRTGGSLYTSAQPVVVGSDGSAASLVTRGTVTMQTKYGQPGSSSDPCGADNGNAVCVSGANASAIIGNGTTLIGSNYGLKSTNATANVTIDGGTIYSFGTYNGNGYYGGVQANGNLTINGGTISSVQAGRKLTVNGGDFKDVTGGEIQQTATPNSRIQIDANATAYLTGGHITPISDTGISILAADNASVHMMTDAQGNLTFGDQLGVKPFIGTPSSKNYKDVSAQYAPLGTSAALVNGQDALYKASADSESTLEALAGDTAATPLVTTSEAGDNGGNGLATMKTSLAQGTTTVFGKIKLNNKGVSGLGGNGSFWVYGKSATFENNPVTAVTIDTASPFVANLNNGSTFGLTAHVDPANAHDLSLNWTSDNTSVASVDASTGVVTAAAPGVANVTVKSATYPDAKGDSMEFIAVKPSVTGSNEIPDNTLRTQLYAGTGLAGDGSTIGKHKVSWQWSVDQPSIATIDAATGVLSKAGNGASGTVTAIARLVLDGKPTDVTAFKTVTVRSLAVNQYYVEWYKKVGGLTDGQDLPADKWTSPAAPNGKIFAGWFSDAAFTKPYTLTSGKAYAKFVNAGLLSVKTQLASGTTADSPTTTLRFITALDSYDYDLVRYDVTVDGLSKALQINNSNAYSTISAGGKSMTAAQVFGDSTAKYFSTGLLRGIPKTYYDKAITVTPSWRTLDGTLVSGAARTVKVSEMIR